MGLLPRDVPRLPTRTPLPHSITKMAHSPPKNVTAQRRLSGSRDEAVAIASANSNASLSKLDQKLTTRINRTTHNGGTIAPRRPQRHSVGETATPRTPAGVMHGPPASPRRPNRHSFSMPAPPRIREESNGDEEDVVEDEVDGCVTVFDTSRLANSPKPPRKFPTARPLRHSVCGSAAEAVASAAAILREKDLIEEAVDTVAAAAAAERKRKRVRFSVPDIRLTEEQLEAFAAAAATDAAANEKDRENQLAAPCSDAFRKAMLDMRFLSVEQRTNAAGEPVPEEAEGDGSDTLSSSPSLET